MPTRAISIALLGCMVLVGILGYSFLREPIRASGLIQALPVLPESAATGKRSPTVLVFEIRPDQSEARFFVDEVLAGAPNTVVGTTDQISGQIAMDANDPASARIGTILIDARSLETDNGARDRMLRTFILGSDEHEYISFSPTRLVGLPATVTKGEPISFQIEGSLTIREVARPVTFEASVTPVSEGEISGRASTTIRYADWGINVPSVPRVASVADEVRLEVDFVAALV